MRKRYWVTCDRDFTESNGTHSYSEMWTTDDFMCGAVKFHREIATNRWDEILLWDSEKNQIIDWWDSEDGYRMV